MVPKKKPTVSTTSFPAVVVHYYTVIAPWRVWCLLYWDDKANPNFLPNIFNAKKVKETHSICQTSETGSVCQNGMATIVEKRQPL